jgi:hypothetical protein
MDVSRHILVLDTSILVASFMEQREYIIAEMSIIYVCHFGLLCFHCETNVILAISSNTKWHIFRLCWTKISMSIFSLSSTIVTITDVDEELTLFS